MAEERLEELKITLGWELDTKRLNIQTGQIALTRSSSQKRKNISPETGTSNHSEEGLCGRFQTVVTFTEESK
eukprot:11778964-Ditylum_brightwellii.AAC.2